MDVGDIRWGELASRIDVALLATHGLGGEDGKVQGLLDTVGIPYSGAGVLACAVGMHKPTFKKIVANDRIDTPRWIEVRRDWSVATASTTIRYTLPGPWFVKPVSGGGSLEASVAEDDTQLLGALEKCSTGEYEEFFVEELVSGHPCSVGLLEIDGTLITLPVHQVQTDRQFYDYEAKHDPGLRRETCPSALPGTMVRQMEVAARRAHHLVGAHGLSRVDFMAAPSGRTAMLEINTVPGLSPHGNLATMAKAAGISYDDLIRHVVATAFTKPSYVP
ncbi:D-alanine--D-alanine ligase [Streptomyces sp. NPDC021224]|uniref:D-alanine--D-alanine ligase family protein n=1 Tax=unclassified Streptomyces TaxID=2593676 RepID=UPI003797AD5C